MSQWWPPREKSYVCWQCRWQRWLWRQTLMTYSDVTRAWWRLKARVTWIFFKNLSSQIPWKIYHRLVDSPYKGQWYVFHDTMPSPLQWCYNERNGVLNHRYLDCLLNHLFKCKKENIKAPRHWPLWGESTGDRWIPLTKASNAENVSIWWRHHECCCRCRCHRGSCCYRRRRWKQRPRKRQRRRWW